MRHSEARPLPITERLADFSRLPFFIAWPAAGATIFGVGALLALFHPEDSFLTAGALLMFIFVLAGLAQSWASIRLATLVDSLLDVSYWPDKATREAAEHDFQLGPVFEYKETILLGLAFSGLVMPLVVFVHLTLAVDESQRWYGTAWLLGTVFLAGMALMRAPRILLLFHRLSRLRILPYAFMYARYEIVLFGRVAGELASIVVAVYTFGFLALVVAPLEIPTQMTIVYLALGAVVTGALFAWPQWQVSELVRRNKSAALAKVSPVLNAILASDCQHPREQDVALLGQATAAASAIKAVPEWVLDPRLVAPFALSAGLQLGVGFAQLAVGS